MLRLLVLIASTLLAFLLQNEEWLNCQKHFAFLIMKFMHFNEILGENAVTQCPNEQKTFKSMQETKTYPSSLFMCYVDCKNQYENRKQENPENVCYCRIVPKKCVFAKTCMTISGSHFKIQLLQRE